MPRKTSSGALTVEIAKDMLGWENEDDYRARMSKLRPETDPFAFQFRWHTHTNEWVAKAPVAYVEDELGRLVVCWRVYGCLSEHDTGECLIRSQPGSLEDNEMPEGGVFLTGPGFAKNRTLLTDPNWLIAYVLGNTQEKSPTITIHQEVP